ncbi:hypothetical protein [uncultured Nostoc sp.]|uniref:hypothetical protein n=1 Tax=uncultured Nostoc sp. TaxID=340711 RepID=UPI0035CA53E4
MKWKEKELQRWIGTSVTEKPVLTEYGGLIHQVSTLTHPVFTEINLHVPISVHPASDVLTLRFCSCKQVVVAGFMNG